MAQVLVRDVDDDVLEELKRRAERHRQSIECEIRSILKDAAGAPLLDRETVLRRMAQIRQELQGQSFSDTVELIREGRDR